MVVMVIVIRVNGPFRASSAHCILSTVPTYRRRCLLLGFNSASFHQAHRSTNSPVTMFQTSHQLTATSSRSSCSSAPPSATPTRTATRTALAQAPQNLTPPSTTSGSPSTLPCATQITNFSTNHGRTRYFKNSNAATAPWATPTKRRTTHPNIKQRRPGAKPAPALKPLTGANWTASVTTLSI